MISIENLRTTANEFRSDYSSLFHAYYFAKIAFSLWIINSFSDNPMYMEKAAMLLFTTVVIEIIIWLASMQNADEELQARYTDDIGYLRALSDIILFCSVFYGAVWVFNPKSIKLANMSLLTATFGNVANALFESVQKYKNESKLHCIRR